MRLLDNPKIARLDVSWAEFRGWSLLFDNPAVQAQAGAHGLMDCRASADPGLGLYQALAAWIEDSGRSRLLHDHGLAAMPTSSFHVTAWDGINAATLPALRPEMRAPVCTWLQGLPTSTADFPVVVAEISELCAALNALMPLEFKYRRLLSTRGIGVVADLAPADTEQRERLEAFQAQRLRIARDCERRWGHAYVSALEPHVTLAYFLSPDAAVPAQALLPAWDEAIRERCDGLRLRFESLSLYGFTDMLHFYRR